MHALTLGLVLAAIAMQYKPAERSSEPRRGDTIVVRGCIAGGTILSSDTEVRDSTARYSGSVTYRLTGEKKALKNLKQEHDGHMDVITGILRSDLPHQNAPRGTRIGNTRVTVGVSDQRGTDPNAPQYMPALQVKQVEHTGSVCPG